MGRISASSSWLPLVSELKGARTQDRTTVLEKAAQGRAGSERALECRLSIPGAFDSVLLPESLLTVCGEVKKC